MAQTDLLQGKELRGLSYSSVLVSSATHGGFFMMGDGANIIKTFDSSSLRNSTLLPPEKTPKGNITAMDFSPSRQFAVVAYGDGMIQLFDLESGKPAKIVAKPHARYATSVVFFNDTTILAAEGTTLMGYKITQRLGFLTIRDFTIGQFPTNVHKIVVPPVYRFVSPKKSMCGAPKFADRLAFCTEKGVSCYDVGNEFKLKSLIYIESPKVIAKFSVLNPDCMYMGITYEQKLDVYKMTGGDARDVIYSTELEFLPAHMSFVAPNVLLVLDNKFDGVIISFEDKFVAKVVCPLKGGVFVDGTHEPVIFSDMKLFTLSLPTFKDKMEEFRGDGDHEAAIELCKKVMSDESGLSLGLPANRSQRALLVESAMGDMLIENTSQALARKEDPEKLAASLVALNKELHLEEWLVCSAVPLFEEAGCLPVLLKQIVMEDPKASIFTYRKQFTEKLLESHPDYDITNFVINLPNRAAPVPLLLKSELIRNDVNFLSQVFFRRIRDVKGGLTVIANAGMYERVCDVMLGMDKNDMECAISWLFSKNSGNEFAHVANILKLDGQVSARFFNGIFEYIDKNGKPFGVDEFTNLLFEQMIHSKIPVNHMLMKQTADIIIQKKVVLGRLQLKRLVEIIFSKEKPEPDNREQLLSYILTCDVPIAFKEALLQLCDTFGFREAKRRIQEDTKNYEATIKEAMKEQNENVFPLMKSLVAKDPEALKSAKKIIFTHAQFFVMKNLDDMIEFVASYMSDSVVPLLREIPNEVLLFTFVHRLQQKEEFRQLKLPNEMGVNYCQFLCKHYPSEVREYVTRRSDTIDKLLPICETFKVYDAVAVIYDHMDAPTEMTAAIVNYIRNQLVFYIRGEQDVDIIRDGQFVVEFVGHQIKDRAARELEPFSKAVLDAFKVSIFALEKEQSSEEKCRNVTEIFRRVCVIVAPILSFSEILRRVVVDYQELHYGHLRSSILDMIRDYEYDVEQNGTMAMLYYDDESKAHAEYIQSLVRGVVYGSLCCATCHHRIIGVPCEIQLFKCGHIFHRTLSCLPKEVCPICNPVDRLDGQPPPLTQTMRPSRFLRVLTRFEYMLRDNEAKADYEDPPESEIAIRPISAFPM